MYDNTTQNLENSPMLPDKIKYLFLRIVNIFLKNKIYSQLSLSNILHIYMCIMEKKKERELWD